MDATKMQDNEVYFRILNYTLLGADQNYAAGRCLWFHLAMREAANLLSLAIEQAMKVLYVQQKLEKRDLQSLVASKHSRNPQYQYDPQEIDRAKINKILAHVLHGLLRDHNLIRLAERLKNESVIDLTGFAATLDKVNEFYDLRYFSPNNTQIGGSEIDNIDRIFFLLRASMRPPLPSNLIIGPAWDVFNNNGRNLFAFSFHQNKSFAQPAYSISG